MDILSQANTTERSEIVLPEEFPKAWLHFLMALIFCSQEQYSAGFEEQSSICSRLLTASMIQVLMNLGQKSLLKYAVFNPWQLASLVNFVLLGGVTASAPDTGGTYSDYLTYLVGFLQIFLDNHSQNARESAIEANPLDRGHQDKLTAFKQESSVI
jgi:hypothetical protein